MAPPCYHASLLCAGALAAAELASALALCPAAVLATARLLLVCVWLSCWSGASGVVKGAEYGAWPPCSSSAEPAKGALVQAAAAGDATGQRRTWRSAGVQLPQPALVMNLIKSRR